MGSRSLSVLLSGLGVIALVIAPVAAQADSGPSEPLKPGTTLNSVNDPVNIWDSAQIPGYLQNQATLNKLQAWVEALPGVSASGYITMKSDVDNLRATFVWHGTDALLTSALSEASVLGVSASTELRPYSLAQYETAADALFAAKDQFKAVGFDVNSTAAINSTSPLPQLVGTYEQGADPSTVQALANKIAGVDVQIQNGPLIYPADLSGAAATATQTATPDYTGASGRQADTSPFYAGAFMTDHHDPDRCSTGFGFSYEGTVRVSTARHCVPNGGNWYAPNGSGRMGGNLTTSDYGAVQLLHGYGAYSSYDGAWNNSSGYYKTVSGYASPGMDQNVCVGGGNSGEHCGMHIVNLDVHTPDPTSSDPNRYVNTVEATSQSNVESAAGGDSGGPVIQSIDGNTVNAVGIIQGSSGEDAPNNCGNIAYAPSSIECGATVTFSYVSTVLNHTNWVLDTN